MGAKVQDGICIKYTLKIGVISSKTMVRTGRSAEQQPHGVAFIAKGRLYADKHVPKLFAEDQQILTIGVESTGRWSPGIMQTGMVRR